MIGCRGDTAGGRGGTFTATRWSQQFWGLRYIDDAAARRGTSDLGEEWERGYYHITNVQFSTESLISDACELIERVRYEACGKARDGWPGDLDGNGSFVEADRNIGVATPAGKTIGEGAYNVLMDFDFSGTIEQDEYDRCQSGTGIAALDAGAVRDPDFDEGPWSAAGYDGYIYDDIADLSCVRFRWYDAGLGRWMTRDPAGYVDGANLSQYVHDAPTRWTDPRGLSATSTYEPVGLEAVVPDLWDDPTRGCGIVLKRIRPTAACGWEPGSVGHQWIEYYNPKSGIRRSAGFYPDGTSGGKGGGAVPICSLWYSSGATREQALAFPSDCTCVRSDDPRYGKGEKPDDIWQTTVLPRAGQSTVSCDAIRACVAGHIPGRYSAGGWVDVPGYAPVYMPPKLLDHKYHFTSFNCYGASRQALETCGLTIIGY